MSSHPSWRERTICLWLPATNVSKNLTLSMSELQVALQQGVIDGQENPPTTLLTSGWYKNQKYLSMTKHQITYQWVAVNSQFYNSMSLEDQKIFLIAISDTEIVCFSFVSSFVLIICCLLVVRWALYYSLSGCMNISSFLQFDKVRLTNPGKIPVIFRCQQTDHKNEHRRNHHCRKFSKLSIQENTA